ncbi:MAG: hypothetical protein Q9211_004322 [Gyalolechia sp. 1 TL-2023]
MAKSDALISGSFALHFFERSVWLPEDLDIYARDGQESNSLSMYLEQSEGYLLVSAKENAEEYAGLEFVVSVRNTTSLVRTYKKQISSIQNTFAEIQVIATSGHPLGLILENYSTTVVVNFISWNKAFAVFPFSTFIQYECFNLKARNRANEWAMNKYKDFGESATGTLGEYLWM